MSGHGHGHGYGYDWFPARVYTVPFHTEYNWACDHFGSPAKSSMEFTGSKQAPSIWQGRKVGGGLICFFGCRLLLDVAPALRHS